MGLTGRPIFFDSTGRRWRRVRRVRLMLAGIVTVMIGALVLSILVNPFLPHLDLPPAKLLTRSADLRPKAPSFPITRRDQKAQHAQAELKTAIQDAKKASQQPLKISQPVPLPSAARPLAIGFYVNWDDSSYSSLKRNLTQLDWIVPEWVRLQDGADPLVRDIDPRVLDLLQREGPDLRILPLVQNYKDEQWNSELLTRAIADEHARTQLVSALIDFVLANKFAGVCIDFEEVPPTAQSALLQFMQRLHAAFAARGLLVEAGRFCTTPLKAIGRPGHQSAVKELAS